MQEGVTPANLRANMASFYRDTDPSGTLGLILVAGNISSIPLLDVLTKMFIEGQVAVVKLNPISDYLVPVTLDAREGVEVRWPAGLRQGRPPYPVRFRSSHRTELPVRLENGGGFLQMGLDLVCR